MPGAWIEKRETGQGQRFRVRFRLGGRESVPMYAGSFERKRDAEARRNWVIGELAAHRVPDIRLLSAPVKAPTLGAAAERWRRSRLDVVEQTRHMHRSSIGRIFKMQPQLRAKRVDELVASDVSELVAAMVVANYKRETIRKTKTALAQILDFVGVEPNVARDERVKLPRERRAHIPPPLAEHVERVVEVLAPKYVLPTLILDECGPRVSELETALVGDLDEDRKAIRVRWTVEKNDRYRRLELPDHLFNALLATLPAREDRDLDAELFPGVTDANLRTAISRACKTAGVPHFAPHGLRRRRGSLHYKRTGSLAEVAELLGDSKRVAGEHYVYALTDYREVDPQPALARLFR